MTNLKEIPAESLTTQRERAEIMHHMGNRIRGHIQPTEDKGRFLAEMWLYVTRLTPEEVRLDSDVASQG